MSSFNSFKKSLYQRFDSLTAEYSKLFIADISKDELWDTYLNSFPDGTNPIYQERREFDCNSCKQFIRPFGNVVVINKKNELESIWDIQGLEYPFDVVAKKLSNAVKSHIIRDVFVSTERKLGVDKNRQLLEDGSVKVWEHFYYELPKTFVYKGNKTIDSVKGSYRDSKNVFKRSMEELTINAGQTILELIDQGSLYRGEEFKKSINTFVEYKNKYDKLNSDLKKDNWCWKNSIDNPVSKIRNTAIGTLLIDLSEDVDLNTAVTKFERVMAPTNYKRPKALITKRMIEDAEKKIKDLGFEDSLGRKYAVLEDITVNNVLFVNRDVKKRIKGSVFDELKEYVPENNKSFDKTEEVHIEDFINKLLPKTKEIEVLMETKHQSNLMSLIAPEDVNAPTMFKWNNNFSWAYNGDITDSLKQNVKNAGGNVEGVLRFSIQWNEDGTNHNDFDAHCKEPGGNEIFYSNKVNRNTTGNLDIDIIQPNDKVAVENITWTDINKMQEGRYKFFVHNYTHRGSNSGFKAEIEYNGEIYSYEYAKGLKQSEKVIVAEIEFSRENGIKFIKSLDSNVSSKEIWGVKTNKFSKVSTVMFSPNYWDEQKGIGNKHYFFMLDKCKNESQPRGFFNEFLKEDLLEHKRVFEALGSKMRVEPSDNQLSGLGFSSTQKNAIIAKINGNFNRTIKIIF